MAKQSSIEWLVEQLEKHHIKQDIKNTVVYQQAKQMHKEEIEDAWNNGMKSDNGHFGTFKEYYKEIYGGNHIVDTNEMIDHIGDANKMVEDTFKVWECCGMEECECGLTPDELIIKDMHNQITSSQIEISDEEIEQYAKQNAFNYYEFITGAKWYREQLKKSSPKTSDN